jgi:hypothetical protein
MRKVSTLKADEYGRLVSTDAMYFTYAIKYTNLNGHIGHTTVESTSKEQAQKEFESRNPGYIIQFIR